MLLNAIFMDIQGKQFSATILGMLVGGDIESQGWVKLIGGV